MSANRTIFLLASFCWTPDIFIYVYFQVAMEMFKQEHIKYGQNKNLHIFHISGIFPLNTTAVFSMWNN